MYPSGMIVLWATISSISMVVVPGISSHVLPCTDDDVPTVASYLQELRSKLLLVESILEEKSKILKEKDTQLEEKGQIIDEMELEIQSLQNVLNNYRNSQAGLEIIEDLDEKVHLLWENSRKNNFELHILEEQVQDNEKKLDELSSHIQKGNDIVTEQWIQIQQLEQALLMAKMRVAKERGKHNPLRWSLPPAIVNLFSSASYQDYIRNYLPGRIYHLRRFFSYIRNYHFMLQHSLRCALESREFSAPLAHDEIVFFLVSVSFVFPLLAMLQFIVGLIR